MLNKALLLLKFIMALPQQLVWTKSMGKGYIMNQFLIKDANDGLTVKTWENFSYWALLKLSQNLQNSGSHKDQN